MTKKNYLIFFQESERGWKKAADTIFVLNVKDETFKQIIILIKFKFSNSK
jgi:hypothetical protein